jgi:hypothetical protein
MKIHMDMVYVRVQVHIQVHVYVLFCHTYFNGPLSGHEYRHEI